MATETITIEIDGKNATVTLRSVRKADGIRRATLMIGASQMEGDEIEKQVAFYQYPTCVCSVEEPEWVRNMSFKEFLERVSEQDVETWLQKAYDLNPQWKKSMNMLRALSEEEEKKTGTLSNGSKDLTENPGTETPSETSPTSKS